MPLKEASNSPVVYQRYSWKNPSQATNTLAPPTGDVTANRFYNCQPSHHHVPVSGMTWQNRTPGVETGQYPTKALNVRRPYRERNRCVNIWQQCQKYPTSGNVSLVTTACAVYENARWGHVAEWLRNGLQNRVHQFNSGRGLHPYNQWLRPII